MLQKWSKEILRFLPVKAQFVLYGNIYDIYPIPLRMGDAETGNAVVPLKISDFIASLLLQEEGYPICIQYEPLVGFSLLKGDKEKAKEITGEAFEPEKPVRATLSRACELIEKVVANEQNYCSVLLHFSSRLSEIAPQQDMNEFFYRMFRMSLESNPRVIAGSHPKYNPVFWLIEKENDIPAWYNIENPRIKNINIPKPDSEVRKIIISSILKGNEEYKNLEEHRQKELISLFVDQTSKMFGSEIISIVSLARREKLPVMEIGEAIRRYKLGIVENPWAKIESEKIEKLEEIIGLRVKGQVKGVRKAGDIVKRSVFNLSGSQFSRYSQKPKGVMFLAGPTGVGKTELAKSIAEAIFGSETAYIRFDMSEFGHEHSDQRLTGAPPGYVGYDVGGELTNSLKQNPFAVVLFDEIEKAHPKILDMFLQILDDGRLTSGRGETVYFSESLIVFTSNLGVYEIGANGERIQRVHPDMGYDEVETKILGAISDFFKFRISRPEILNRIGENIVVFDFIRQDVASLIFKKMFENVLYKARENNRIDISISEDIVGKIRDIACSDLSMGGRGIGNRIEMAFINPLSRKLVELKINAGDAVRVLDIVQNQDNDWNLIIEREVVKIV